MSELAHADLLILIAEIAATFIGFSIVVGLLQPDSRESKFRLESMRAVAELAMIAGLGALLTLALHAFGIETAVIWRCVSGFTALTWLWLHQLAAKRWALNGFPWRKLPKLQFAGYFSFLGITALVLNAIFAHEQASATLATALILALGISGFVFVVVTFGQPHDPPNKSVESDT